MFHKHPHYVIHLGLTLPYPEMYEIITDNMTYPDNENKQWIRVGKLVSEDETMLRSGRLSSDMEGNLFQSK